MVWKGNRGDEAVSPIIATILLVAIAIVACGVLYSSVSKPSTDAAAMAITAAPPDADDERTYIISAATPNLGWGRLSLKLDGALLEYDDALSTDGTWCQLAEGNACVSAAQHASADMVEGGQKIRVHDAGVSRATLEVVDVDANMLLARVTLRP